MRDGGVHLDKITAGWNRPTRAHCSELFWNITDKQTNTNGVPRET